MENEIPVGRTKEKKDTPTGRGKPGLTHLHTKTDSVGYSIVYGIHVEHDFFQLLSSVAKDQWYSLEQTLPINANE
jgi:hypothetical protein